MAYHGKMLALVTFETAKSRGGSIARSVQDIHYFAVSEKFCAGDQVQDKEVS